MSNDENIITVGDNDYKLDDFTPEQMNAFNHVQNIDRKIGQAQFNLDEMLGGREYWATVLKNLLEAEPEQVEAAE